MTKALTAIYNENAKGTFASHVSHMCVSYSHEAKLDSESCENRYTFVIEESCGTDVGFKVMVAEYDIHEHPCFEVQEMKIEGVGGMDNYIQCIEALYDDIRAFLKVVNPTAELQ